MREQRAAIAAPAARRGGRGRPARAGGAARGGPSLHDERRSSTFMMLPPSVAGEIPAPSEDELKTFFDERKVVVPRARDPRGRRSSCSTRRRWPSPTRSAPRTCASATSRSRGTLRHARAPHIQQIAFPDAEEAEARARQIEAGETFEAVAPARGVDAEGPDARHLHEGRAVRPGGGGGRLRAAPKAPSARRCRAASGPCSCASPRSSPRAVQAARRGRGRDPQDHRRGARPAEHRHGARQDRGPARRRQAAGRDRQGARPAAR